MRLQNGQGKKRQDSIGRAARHKIEQRRIWTKFGLMQQAFPIHAPRLCAQLYKESVMGQITAMQRFTPARPRFRVL